MIKAVEIKQQHLTVMDVRQTPTCKFGEAMVIPYEANLLVLKYDGLV